jgi:hypothetical protein
LVVQRSMSRSNECDVCGRYVPGVPEGLAELWYRGVRYRGHAGCIGRVRKALKAEGKSFTER